MLVTHHPLFALPVGDGPELGKAIGRQERALDVIAEPASICCSPATITAPASTTPTDLVTRRRQRRWSSRPGTATSTRLRDEEQSFNRIEVEPAMVQVTVQRWTEARVPLPATARHSTAPATQWRKAKRRQASKRPNEAAELIACPRRAL